MEDVIKELMLDEFIQERTHETVDRYEDYIRLLKQFNFTELKTFLTMIEQNELLSTQSMEGENSTLIRFLYMSHRFKLIEFAKSMMGGGYYYFR